MSTLQSEQPLVQPLASLNGSETMRHVLTLADMSAAEIDSVFTISDDIKTKFEKGVREPLLPGRVLGLLFEKPSLRTRVSFEAGMAHMGGGSLFLGEDVGWRNGRESVQDFANVISTMLDAIVCRAKAHATVAELALHCSIPVINGLTDLAHPCQALADLYTLRERSGPLAGRQLTYIGDANNVAYSLAIVCAKLEVKFVIASPSGYNFADDFFTSLQADHPGADLKSVDDPQTAVAGADAVYTDVWASMGQEGERDARKKAFAAYQVNDQLMAAAPDTAIFLHCLPARRGEEVTDSVIDSPQSAVIQQAANRMHVQKGLLAWLLT